MGGRGSNLGDGGSGRGTRIFEQTDVWSFRHDPNNEAAADSVIKASGLVQQEFPDVMRDVTTVNVADLGKDGQGVLGFFVLGEHSVNLNKDYANVQLMTSVYDKSVTSGFHPSRGSYNGVEAVMVHEMGHAVTQTAANKIFKSENGDLDLAAKRVVTKAYKDSGAKGGYDSFAGKISGYAKESNAECIAEAVADVICNGNKAASESHAVYNALKFYANK